MLKKRPILGCKTIFLAKISSPFSPRIRPLPPRMSPHTREAERNKGNKYGTNWTLNLTLSSNKAAKLLNYKFNRLHTSILKTSNRGSQAKNTDLTIWFLFMIFCCWIFRIQQRICNSILGQKQGSTNWFQAKNTDRKRS